MSALGLLMFAVAMLLIVLTGLPVYAVLLGVSSVFAAIGVALGAFDAALLLALPSRIVGLLEHDLLQALPLYAFIGALLNHLPLAGLLHRAGERLFARSAASAELSALGVGALLAPMNGSVGASLHTLSRGIAPALAERGTPPARATATVCVASTLGIVIPPSLVLLLLGDAMMRAHTEAANATHAAVRIVNTQDVMRAALVPGLLVLLTAMTLATWRPGPAQRRAAPALRPTELTTAVVSAGRRRPPPCTRTPTLRRTAFATPSTRRAHVATGTTPLPPATRHHVDAHEADQDRAAFTASAGNPSPSFAPAFPKARVGMPLLCARGVQWLARLSFARAVGKVRPLRSSCHWERPRGMEVLDRAS